MASDTASLNSAAQSPTTSDERSFGSKLWYVLRRWPLVPILVVALLIFMALSAPWLAPFGQDQQNLRARQAPPIWYTEYYEEMDRLTDRFILGADHLGRDILTRIMYGARISLAVAGISLVVGVSVGATIGMVSGFYGRIFDELMMRLVDVWNALPFLLIAILAAIVFGQSVTVLLVLLILATWAGVVRNVRAEVLTLKTRDYVAYSRVAGGSDFRIMWRHLTPGLVNTVVVLITLRVGGLILTEAGLSFLGAGVPSNIPTWGNMVSDARQYLNTAWWMAVFPGLAILLIVMSVNFIGDWLRDRWDPRLRQL